MSRNIVPNWKILGVLVVLLSVEANAQEAEQRTKQLPPDVLQRLMLERGQNIERNAARRKQELDGAALGIQPSLQRGQPLGTSGPGNSFGAVVTNVVVAKIQKVGDTSELIVAKFGHIEPPAKTIMVTSFKQEKMTRKLEVNGKTIEEEYTMNVPITTEVPNPRFIPTETDRSIAVDFVQAFDLQGKPVEKDVWMKALETPKHVLLIREPIGENNQLDPFYSAILREDLLMLYLKKEPEQPESPKEE